MNFRIERSRKLEDCLDGSIIFELIYNNPIESANIKSLSRIGELDYFPDFPSPFYRVTAGDNLQLKGVEGALTSRLILFRGNIENVIRQFNRLFDD